ncbi:MAG: TatD family hydrolase [Patescibacteria group bacterium]|nr:TatD family hydrolase [Patescibacteria group bacterium]MDE2116853.1 TatD family hydrolase [Patescibacteria group bacterium]
MKPRFIDIHAHTNFSAFDVDRRDVVERALAAGIWMINIGTQRDTSRRAVDMTREFPEGVYAIVGLHPVHANASFHDAEELGGAGAAHGSTAGFTSRGEVFDKDFYRSLVHEGGKKVVGIGECGLDYYRMPTDEERVRQIVAFRAQVELAIELDLPLMLHVRSGKGGDAYRDVLNILREYKKGLSATGDGAKLRGDAHFFAGTAEYAQEFLDLGFCLSYTGVVTFAKEYEALVRATPSDRVMSETDCPYVSPAPERGKGNKRNEPLFVTHIADKIIGIQGLDLESGRAQLVENAMRLFNIP